MFNLEFGFLRSNILLFLKISVGRARIEQNADIPLIIFHMSVKRSR